MKLNALRASFVAVAMSALAASCAPQATETETAQAPAQTIYLVRHAEKQKGDNPGLTDAGHERAQALKNKLQDEGVQYVHSSNYRRTLETAQPLAEAIGVDVRLYDPRDLESFADDLSAVPGVHLVVGHSNTTPQLAKILAGADTDYMPETEYNRFYTVTISPDGSATLDVSTFGAPSE